MNTTKYKWCVFFLSLAFATTAYAQTENGYKTLIMGVPQYLIKNGVRIDIERKLSPSHWLRVEPIIYLKDNYQMDTDGYDSDQEPFINQMYGAGLGISSVHILYNTLQQKKRVTFYVTYGASYTLFNFNITEKVWKPYTTEDGLTFQHKVPDTYNLRTSKLGADATIGMRKELFKRLFLDIYLGFGLRYSVVNPPEGFQIPFNSNFIDYGYSGTTLVGGVRLGVGL